MTNDEVRRNDETRMTKPEVIGECVASSLIRSLSLFGHPSLLVIFDQPEAAGANQQLAIDKPKTTLAPCEFLLLAAPVS
jgi:hypothetical protein